MGCFDMAEIEKVIEQLEQLKFFNQRAGRELWNSKPTNIQNVDIDNAEKKLDEAIQTIRELQEQIPKWHLCEEELPKELEFVLTVDKDGRYEIGYKMYNWSNKEHKRIYPIAWTELPKFEGVE